MDAPCFLTAVVAGDMHDMQIEFVVRLLLTLAPLCCPLKIEHPVLGCHRTRTLLMSPPFLHSIKPISSHTFFLNIATGPLFELIDFIAD